MKASPLLLMKVLDEMDQNQSLSDTFISENSFVEMFYFLIFEARLCYQNSD